MKQDRTDELKSYYDDAATWAADRRARDDRSRSLAWLIAGGASLIAVLEALALLMLTPLKTVQPYTLLVDRQTGYVEELKPLERQTVTADAALTRSFLVQYVIARESFDIPSLRSNYRKVALWSAPSVRSLYIAGVQATNPASPLATLPRSAQVNILVKSVSALGPTTSLVRFQSHRVDAAAGSVADQDWAAVISYRFSGEAMTVDDRLINPLGFEVTRYRRDAETLPEPASVTQQIPAAYPDVIAKGPTASVPTAGRSPTPRTEIQQ